MMNNKLIAGFIYIIIVFSSCLKKDNDYIYDAPEEIHISGILSNYNAVTGVDTLVITPQVSTTQEGTFEYIWGVYEKNAQGVIPTFDTISREKTLNYPIIIPAKNWVLVCVVTNTKTGLSKYFTADLNVVTAYTRGWYVAKHDGDSTDLDLFLTPNTISAEERLENVYSMVNGQKINGRAMLMNYYDNYVTDILEEGKFLNTKTLFVLTDKEVSATAINSLENVHTLNSLYYSAPTVHKPGFITAANSALYLSNNGGVSTIYSMSVNSGIFGITRLRDDKGTPYYLSNYFMGTTLAVNPTMYDELSSTFMTAASSGSYLTQMVDDSATALPSKNINKDLLFMGAKEMGVVSQTGIAVLKDKSDPSLMIIATITVGRNFEFKASCDTISITKHIFNATKFAINYDENILYFVSDNKVWSYNLSSKAENLQYTPPSGEEITFLRHRNYNRETEYSYNYIMVGTKLGEAYKVRMFTKTSGNLSSSPVFTLEGNGEVGDVMYITPLTNTTTYINSY